MRQGRDETLKAINPWACAALCGGALLAAGVLRGARRRRFTFRDKTVLITGGSRGLGIEMARLFAEEGAQLVLVGRNASTLETARAELEKFGSRVLTIPCDVRRQEDMTSAVMETIRHFGGLDVLINNAGIIQVGPSEEMTLKDYEDAMATHAWAPLYAIMAAVPQMRKQGGGRIVNVSSIAGKIGVPHLLPYVMSKFALAGLSEGLRTEVVSDKILVTTVYPGLMRTGSHVNASFKGKNQKEYAWFSIAAGLPVVSINARRAAQQIVEACREGREQLVITPTAKAATVAGAVSPGLMDFVMRLMDALLPAPAETRDKRARSGWESRSWLSPSALTRMADSAIERNNEHRGVGGTPREKMAG
jgi:NAD(P)-dependent dehydrogenase (short-subunit alcohol dehydrogenase family)